MSGRSNHAGNRRRSDPAVATSGFRKPAVYLARRVVEFFEPYAAVVLPGGSCAGMLRGEYSHLFATQPDWRERAQALAAKTYELSEFLVHCAAWLPPTAPDAPRVTYHDSCHMKRRLHLSQVWLSLLARSATGQPLSIYTSIITGPARPGDPDGPREVHIVLLDNGRSRQNRLLRQELIKSKRMAPQ